MSYFDKNNANFSGDGGNLGFFNEGGDSDDVVSVGGWIGILILTAIPFVNIIGLIIMAFSTGNRNIKNYGRASLIVIAIPLSLAILLRACS